MFSVTKSIFSVLIGIAIDKGYIESVDQKVLDFFPDYTVKRGEKNNTARHNPRYADHDCGLSTLNRTEIMRDGIV